MVFSFSFFICISPTRSRYKELGINLVEPLQDQPHKPRRSPMVEENKDEGAGDPIKILLEEALEKQRNVMMDNFSHTLQSLPIDNAFASCNHFGGAICFKVKVSFEIPLFEGQIDADTVDRWFNLLEVYFSVHDFFDREKITLHSSNSPPVSKTGGRIRSS